jgi:hypothetical protein
MEQQPRQQCRMDAQALPGRPGDAPAVARKYPSCAPAAACCDRRRRPPVRSFLRPTPTTDSKHRPVRSLVAVTCQISQIPRNLRCQISIFTRFANQFESRRECGRAHERWT